MFKIINLANQIAKLYICCNFFLTGRDKLIKKLLKGFTKSNSISTPILIIFYIFTLTLA